MKIAYAPRALRDLQSIADYLQSRNPQGSSRVLAAIKATIETLASLPHIGVTLDKAGHRRVPVPRYPYLIFYRISSDELFILHIRHSARAPLDPAAEL